jgi:hypothetical protein
MPYERFHDAAKVLASQGVSRPGGGTGMRYGLTTWALLVAHAAGPMTHRDAARLARSAEPLARWSDKTDTHPRLVPGNGALAYWLKLRQNLEPAVPTCADGHARTEDCGDTCRYGVTLAGRWVHDLLMPPPPTP